MIGLLINRNIKTSTLWQHMPSFGHGFLMPGIYKTLTQALYICMMKQR